jgi:Uma2 family endonuclease
MTALHSIQPVAKTGRRAGRLPAKAVTSDDVAALWTLAESLAGQPMPGVRMTEAEFEAWCDEDVRAEWIDGEVILLSPSNVPRVRLNMWLYSVLRAIVAAENSGEVLIMEIQTRLEAVRQRRNPDLLFVSRARQQIIKHTYIDGPPDLVMEIVSADSRSRDWRVKFAAYEKSGVREYWVIDPEAKQVEAYALGRNGKFALIREADGKVRSKVMRTLYIRPEWLWTFPMPTPESVLKELGVGR